MTDIAIQKQIEAIIVIVLKQTGLHQLNMIKVTRIEFKALILLLTKLGEVL